ncbi:MAG TPA: peptide ABC transporter substrate-binding protein [Azospirillaceae bacterium]|nr:peptide ABC transporter substrate-binding protein [Azospirillaceae bacterium]
MKRTPAALAAATAAMAVLLCAARPAAAADPAPPAKAETLTIGVNDFPGTWNPNTEAQGIKAYIAWMAYRPLTYYDADWNLACGLCTELPSREKGTAWPEKLPDGRTGVALKYTLNPKAVWGDGTPVTTRDVLFTWRVGRHDDTGFANQYLFSDDIRDIEAVDDKTFIVRRSRYVCSYAELNDFLLLPSHLEREAFEKDPSGYKVHSRYESDTTNPGLWMGPYRVAKVEPGASVILERNPRWYGKRPHFDRIVVRSLEQSAALEQAMLAGDVDYVAGEYGFSVHQASQLEKHHGHKFDVVWKQGLSYRHLDVNHDNPALRDVRVRRALLMAINRDLINDRLYYGRNVMAHGFVNPLDSVYEADVPQYPFNPAAAGKLLDEAGWILGQDGVRRNAAGKPLSVELVAVSGDRTIDLELQIIRDAWRRVGVSTETRTAIARVMFGDLLTERKFTGLALFSWVATPLAVPRTTLHSDAVPTADNGWAGQNFLGYRDPKMDALIERTESQCEPKGSRQAWGELQRYYAEQLPALPIFFQSDAFFFPRWLKGVTPTGHQFDSTIAVEDWHRAEPEPSGR